MGPDCGTAVVGGVGLGFANVVRPGPVGIVAASGTGAQHLLALLDGAGVGVAHCLGVGGRDLSAAVGGASTLRRSTCSTPTPATELIVVVSKPPDDRGGRRGPRATPSALATPVLFGLLGPGQPDLTETAAVRGRGGRRHLDRARALDRRRCPPPARRLCGPVRGLLRRGGTPARRADDYIPPTDGARRAGLEGHDGRLRRRRADPRATAPDDRRLAAHRPAACRGRRPVRRRAAPRRRARPRLPTRTPRPSWRAAASRDPRAGVPVVRQRRRHPRRPAGPARHVRRPCTTPAPPCTCPTPPRPARPSAARRRGPR